MPLSDVEWAAGLFEGEGCITTQKTKTHIYPRFQLGMTDYDIVERFARVIGLNNLSYQDRTKWNAKAKPICVWWGMGWAFAEYFGDLIVPRLGVRRRARYAEVMAMRP